MTALTNINLNDPFLTDKKWWVEENEQEYILFVKTANRAYKVYIKKDTIELAKKRISNPISAKFAREWEWLLINELKIAINKIKLEIMKDELGIMKQTI